ncbi:hypothetical protein BX616_009287 [Lobosporangium transversale]|nr:hypothetical protein BX616_009287 [Lobosporangium transversale]
MKNQPMNSRFHHSPASLFVLSTKSTGVIAAVSVGLAAAAHPYGARLSHGGLLLSAISFFEAPVKFLAPTPARRTLIDVGRHVFSAFNKVEVALAAFDLLGWYLITQRGLINSSGSAFTTTTTSGSGTIRSSSFFTGLRQLSAHQWVFRFAPSLIVFVFESFGFLPVLRDVGARYIEGRPVETKRVHGIYVLLEVVKVATLAVSTLRVGKTLLKML